MQLGQYYKKRLEVGVALYINGQEYDVDMVSKKFVEFPELELKWPEIKNVTGMEDAKPLFRLANTQFKKAVDHYVLDGYVTEHVQCKQALSICYKQLSKIETDVSRACLMHQRRAESLEAIKGELNPNAYQVRMMEFGAELSDIYSDLYELELRKPQKSMDRLNEMAQKCKENSDIFTKICYAKDDPAEKFEYLTTMLNLELSSASKLTKWITADP